MALDKEYFDGIQIDLVKKKYYNANKVNAVFADIQAQAQTLLEENEQMRAQLARLNGQKAEIGEAVLSAQQIYREIVDKANVRAAEIVAGAEKRREEIQAENLRQQRRNPRRRQRRDGLRRGRAGLPLRIFHGTLPPRTFFR